MHSCAGRQEGDETTFANRCTTDSTSLNHNTINANYTNPNDCYICDDCVPNFHTTHPDTTNPLPYDPNTTNPNAH